MTASLLKPVNDIPSPESSSRGSSTTLRPSLPFLPAAGPPCSTRRSPWFCVPLCSTQEINYIHRSFVSEYRALGFQDAEQRLRGCIAETAFKYNLGADWMNDHADVALPWASECVLTPPPSLTRFHFLSKLTMDHLWFFPSVHKAVPTIPSSTQPPTRKTPSPKQSSARGASHS